MESKTRYVSRYSIGKIYSVLKLISFSSMILDSQWMTLDQFNSLGVQIVGNELIISKATRKHSGSYGCLVSNNIEPNLWSELILSIDGNSF